ncbi:MAG: Sec-independent protein translocase protein TatB [Bacteroidota bacterium]
MFDIGWQELFLIGVVALIVVGPKDLPKVLRSAARVMNKARAMSREFQAGLAEMAREVELDEIRRNVERNGRFDLGEELRSAADPTGKLSADFDPAEFNRKLKETVESRPPARYPEPPAWTGVEPPVAARETAFDYPLGDPSPTDISGRATPSTRSPGTGCETPAPGGGAAGG